MTVNGVSHNTFNFFLICANILRKVAQVTNLLGFLILILEKIVVLNIE